MRPTAPLLAVVLLLALAGCFSKAPAPTTLTMSAAGGTVSPGWAYDGTGLVPGSAQLSGYLDDTSNGGIVNVSFDYHAAKYMATFSKFTEAKPFQQGGIRFDFDEHGDSQNGDSNLPKVRARAAAWGTATVTRDGELHKGGKTTDDWVAHLMVLSDTVRSPDGKITKADGTTPYSPATPTDAKVTTGDPQVIFFIQSPDGVNATRAPMNDSKVLAFQGPENVQTVDIPAEKGAETLTVNITFSGAGPSPVGLGRATVQLKDAGGNATKTADVTLAPNQPSVVTFTLTGKEITGAYKVSIDGAGAFSAKVDTKVTYDDHPFIVLTWDDVTLT